MEAGYKSDEDELKNIRLSIEQVKLETMDKMDTMNLKSPGEWRDRLANFRIRRHIINRDRSIDEYDKETVYQNTIESSLALS